MSDEFTAPEFWSAALLTIDVQLDFLDDGPAAIPGTDITARVSLTRTASRSSSSIDGWDVVI